MHALGIWISVLNASILKYLDNNVMLIKKCYMHQLFFHGDDVSLYGH